MMMKRPSKRLLKTDRQAKDVTGGRHASPQASKSLVASHLVDGIGSNSDGKIAVPPMIWLGMVKLIESVAQPLAAIEVDLAASEARVLCATRGAMDLLDIEANPSESNHYLSEFLEHCLSLCDSANPDIRWCGASGVNYRLECEMNRLSEFEFSIVRFFLEEEEKATDEELKQSALEKGLTAAEARAFVLMAKGLGNKEIATALQSSVHTVRAHLRSIFRTLKVSGRVEAINAVRKHH